MTPVAKPAVHPAESWGGVAIEALRHPYESGVFDITLGAINLAVGYAESDLTLKAFGAGFMGWGASEMYTHIKKYRPRPLSKLDHH